MLYWHVAKRLGEILYGYYFVSVISGLCDMLAVILLSILEIIYVRL